jgi:hypothetical protein
MVNGLWGFQNDWNKMHHALQAADTCGSCVIHVSGVNTGALTYDGEHCLRMQGLQNQSTLSALLQRTECDALHVCCSVHYELKILWPC